MMNNNDNGFTLIELIVVILVISIVAVSAIPNTNSSTDYSAVTSRDQLISLFRSVQTRAMQNTQNSDCYGVGFTTSNIGMLKQSASGSCTTTFQTTPDAIDGYLNLKPETTYTTTDVFIQFNDFGQPLDNGGNNTGRVTVVFNSSESVCIESEGYIHVCS